MTTRRKLTNQRDKQRRGYQHGYGYRPTNDWGGGDLPSPWAEGDVVEIPEGGIAFKDGRIPHSWSQAPELCKPGLYRVTTVFSIGEGDEWYIRVYPIVDGETIWGESSDRLHMLPGTCNFTEDWTLVETGDPGGVRSWPVELPPNIRHLPTRHDDDAIYCDRCGAQMVDGRCRYEGYP